MSNDEVLKEIETTSKIMLVELVRAHNEKSRPRKFNTHWGADETTQIHNEFH